MSKNDNKSDLEKMAVIDNKDAGTSTTSLQKKTEEVARDKWANKAEFILSCLGLAVGFGNIWRFPYLCYTNGGGAFLIPYFIMLIICGLPIFFLELALGQYHGRSPVILFKNLGTAFHGIGVSMIVSTTWVVTYYNMIIAWAIFYFFASFQSELGWQSCGNEWNTQNCFTAQQNEECKKQNMTYWNNTCTDIKIFCQSISGKQLNGTHCVLPDGSLVSTFDFLHRVSPSEDYYLHHVLRISGSISNIGGINLRLVLCLFGAWAITAACLIKGIKSVGKVVYFTALFPYVVLITLLLRGLTLQGSSAGIYYYIIPNWAKLTEAQVWGDAATQTYYSLSIGLGGMLTLSSYNEFHNDCYRDAIFVAVTNSATSIFSGFVIFSTLGFMAFSLNVPINSVVTSGSGLAFIVYPEAATKMPLAQFWSFLFFFMLISLGLDSQFALCETVITAIYDKWPKYRDKKPIVVITFSTICFIVGLPFCTGAGLYFFRVVDYYSSRYSPLMINLAEIVVVSWSYGINRFNENIYEMIGRKTNAYWKLCWTFLSPMTIALIFISMFIQYKPLEIGDYIFPLWANVIGWCITLSCVIMIPVLMAYELNKMKTRKVPCRSAFFPTDDWGPAISFEEKERANQKSGCHSPNINKNINDKILNKI